MLLSASLQPRLDLIFQVPNNELRHRMLLRTIDIMISIVCWLFNGRILMSGADGMIRPSRAASFLLSVWTMA
jgi:hypothetical protein